MRNGDKLRQMTDEDMAKIINLACPPGKEISINCGCDDVMCEWCWMCWMAEEDD